MQGDLCGSHFILLHVGIRLWQHICWRCCVSPSVCFCHVDDCNSICLRLGLLFCYLALPVYFCANTSFYYHDSVVLCLQRTLAVLKRKRKSILSAGDCLGNLPKSCSPEAHHYFPFMHKTHILVDILRLARTVGKKRNYGSEKARLIHLETFQVLEVWTRSSMG